MVEERSGIPPLAPNVWNIRNSRHPLNVHQAHLRPTGAVTVPLSDREAQTNQNETNKNPNLQELMEEEHQKKLNEDEKYRRKVWTRELELKERAYIRDGNRLKKLAIVQWAENIILDDSDKEGHDYAAL